MYKFVFYFQSTGDGVTGHYGQIAASLVEVAIRVEFVFAAVRHPYTEAYLVKGKTCKYLSAILKPVQVIAFLQSCPFLIRQNCKVIFVLSYRYFINSEAKGRTFTCKNSLQHLVCYQLKHLQIMACSLYLILI